MDRKKRKQRKPSYFKPDATTKQLLAHMNNQLRWLSTLFPPDSYFIIQTKNWMKAIRRYRWTGAQWKAAWIVEMKRRYPHIPLTEIRSSVWG